MESGICRKYQRFYRRHCLAYAPINTNSLGQCGPDLLKFSWNLADQWQCLLTTMHKQCLDFLWMKIPFSPQHPLSSKQQIIVNSVTLRPKIQRKLPKNFDIYLRRNYQSYLWNWFQLDLFPKVHQMVWAASTQLVSHFSQIWHGSGFFSQNITIFSIQQFKPELHYPCSFLPMFSAGTTFYFSNPSLIDVNEPQLLHLDTHSLPTPTWGRRWRRKPSSSPAPPSPPPSTPRGLFYPTSTPTHWYICQCFTFSIHLYQCPPLMTLLASVHKWILYSLMYR